MKTAVTFSVLCLCLACASSKPKSTTGQLEALKTCIANKQFTIESTWAYPQVTSAVSQVLNTQLLAPGNNASAISLIGNANYLTVKGDSVSSYLPYYGERQMATGYGALNDTAIQLNGIMQNFTVNTHKNKSKSLRFKALGNNEVFNVTITIFPDLSTQTTITSAYRRAIQYAGKVQTSN